MGGGGVQWNYYAGSLLFLKLFTHGNEQSWSSMQGSSNTTWALPCHRDYQWKHKYVTLVLQYDRRRAAKGEYRGG